MNRITLGLALVAAILMARVVKAETAPSLITGSAHDFSTKNWQGSNEICKPCHTPHNAPTPASISSRMWNHNLTTATYILHGSSGATGSYSTVLDNSSRLCMSCHDGTVHLDAFGGANGSIDWAAGDKKNLGTDMSNDHPVGQAALYKAESSSYKSLDTTTDATTGLKSYATTVGGKLRLVDLKIARTVPDPNDATKTITTGKTLAVGCSTCHTAHGAGDGGLRYDHLLRMQNGASALCLTCHNK